MKTRYAVENMTTGKTFYTWAYSLDDVEAMLCMFDDSYDYDITSQYDVVFTV